MWVCYEALGVSLSQTAPGADLGGSSKYSNESFEDRSGEGFHVNSSWTWVSRSCKTGGVPHTQALPRILKGEWGW